MSGFDLNVRDNPEEEAQEQQEDDESMVTVPPFIPLPTSSNNSEPHAFLITYGESLFPLDCIVIGSWQLHEMSMSMPGAKLQAVIWYRDKILAWHIEVGQELMLIKIPWDCISAIKRTIEPRTRSFILQVQLSMRPTFYRRTEREGRQPIWFTTSDFTADRQATKISIHNVLIGFTNKDRDKVEGYYEKMLECDARLHHLSQMPFPRTKSPYFDLMSPASASTSANDYSSHASYTRPIEALTTPNPILTGNKTQTSTSQGRLNVDANKVAVSSQLQRNMDLGLSLSLGGNVGFNVDKGKARMI